MQIEVKNRPEAVARRAFWLAWQAAGGPVGMGWLQNRPDADEAAVWQNVRTAGDYPSRKPERAGRKPEKAGRAYGDYVFGRMLKLMLQWDGRSVTAPDHPVNREYQGWAGRYTTYASLIEAADASLTAGKAVTA